jgi:hypothetical protein
LPSTRKAVIASNDISLSLIDIAIGLPQIRTSRANLLGKKKRKKKKHRRR